MNIGVPARVVEYGTTFRYDGLSFWRDARRGRQKLVTSWQSPAFGWVHEDDCDCRLCMRDGQQLERRAA